MRLNDAVQVCTRLHKPTWLLKCERSGQQTFQQQSASLEAVLRWKRGESFLSWSLLHYDSPGSLPRARGLKIGPLYLSQAACHRRETPCSVRPSQGTTRKTCSRSCGRSFPDPRRIRSNKSVSLKWNRQGVCLPAWCNASFTLLPSGGTYSSQSPGYYSTFLGKQNVWFDCFQLSWIRQPLVKPGCVRYLRSARTPASTRCWRNPPPPSSLLSARVPTFAPPANKTHSFTVKRPDVTLCSKFVPDRNGAGEQTRFAALVSNFWEN